MRGHAYNALRRGILASPVGRSSTGNSGKSILRLSSDKILRRPIGSQIRSRVQAAVVVSCSDQVGVFVNAEAVLPRGWDADFEEDDDGG
mmetsp:Transcript_49984/g.74247  ORF Transcript_49984/g.74247 Transcript_49984/m.74247 type:complete len:89 (-) Transcript_49984:221-487(-)